jgi:hypothetical protein
LEKKREEEDSHANQENAQNQGFSFHKHAKKMKKEREVKLEDNCSKKEKGK